MIYLHHYCRIFLVPYLLIGRFPFVIKGGLFREHLRPVSIVHSICRRLQVIVIVEITIPVMTPSIFTFLRRCFASVFGKLSACAHDTALFNVNLVTLSHFLSELRSTCVYWYFVYRRHKCRFVVYGHFYVLRWKSARASFKNSFGLGQCNGQICNFIILKFK